MKQLLLLLIATAAGCYERKEEAKPVQVVQTKQAVRSPEFVKAEELYKQQNDSAFYYFNQFVNSSKDSQEVAIAYNYMGLIQREAGDYFGSQETLLGAIQHLDPGLQSDQYSLFSVYTVLGNNYVDLKNYNVAIRYYDTALKFAYSDHLKPYPLNGKALAYEKKKQYAEALKIYNSIIDQSVSNKKEYARILSNSARAKWLQDPDYPPLPELWKAMHIRQNEKDNWGLNASYSHLSDYYSKSQPDSALVYARKMYAIAQFINNPDDKLEALLKLIKLSPSENRATLIDLYQQLNDSLQTARSNAKNQFAVIRYESEKNKADNLVLQKDNAENKVQIIRQRITIYSTAVVFILGLLIGFNWYMRRKRRMEQEHQNAVRETQLKLSRKVHDVVANGLYGIMNTIEHGPAYNKEQLMDKLEILYEQSRDISYEKPDTPVEGFQQTVAELLTAYAGPSTKVSVVGNNNELWDQVNAQAKKELVPVLQELMVNMKKHSRAKNVVIKFERQDGQAVVLYQDDGIGFTQSFQYGNGLTNTGNRIKAIGGHIIFDRDITNGLKIIIYFPIA